MPDDHGSSAGPGPRLPGGTGGTPAALGAPGAPANWGAQAGRGAPASRGAPAGRERSWLRWLNQLPEEDAAGELLGCCAAPGWARRVAAGRPYRSVDELLAAADAAWADREPGDLEAAMAGHPRIGERSGLTGWSRREQSGVGSGTATLDALGQANVAYERRFGHVFLICATGRGPDEIMAELRRRMANDPATELRVAAAELGKINAIRLRKLVAL